MLRRRPGPRTGEPTSRVKRRSATAGRGRPTPATQAPSSPAPGGDTPANLHDARTPTPFEVAVTTALNRYPLRSIEHAAHVGRHRLATLREHPLAAKLFELVRLQAAGLLVLTVAAIPRHSPQRFRTD